MFSNKRDHKVLKCYIRFRFPTPSCRRIRITVISTIDITQAKSQSSGYVFYFIHAISTVELAKSTVRLWWANCIGDFDFVVLYAKYFLLIIAWLVDRSIDKGARKYFGYRARIFIGFRIFENVARNVNNKVGLSFIYFL